MIDKNLKQTIKTYASLFSHRNAKIFSEFLPRGYRHMTLSCVPEEIREELVIAKVYLGMLITLYDDFADNPHYFNPTLLVELYKIPFQQDELASKLLSDHEKNSLQFAKCLADKIMQCVTRLKHYSVYKKIFEFDWLQFYNCNRYFEIAMDFPAFLNAYEVAQYNVYNMGMLIIGTMDLMASSRLVGDELAVIREFFHYGQRFSRISNTLTTLEREIAEGDFSNELLIKAFAQKYISPDQLGLLTMQQISRKLKPLIQELMSEQENLLDNLQRMADRITFFDSTQYIDGLQAFHLLHERSIGVI